MILRLLLYILLFCFAYIGFILASLPIGLAWEQAQKHLPVQSLPVKISNLQGTLWNGQGRVSYQGISGGVHWRAELADIWRGALPVSFKTTGEFANFKGRAQVGLGRVEIDNVSGSANIVALNPVLKRHRLTLDGEFVANNLSIALDGQQLAYASGQFAWSGGNIEYPAGRNIHKRNLPMFKGSLTPENGDYILRIRDAEGEFDSISGALKPDGWAMLEVKRRILDLSNEPWPSNSSATDTVFKVKRKIF